MRTAVLILSGALALGASASRAQDDPIGDALRDAVVPPASATPPPSSAPVATAPEDEDQAEENPAAAETPSSSATPPAVQVVPPAPRAATASVPPPSPGYAASAVAPYFTQQTYDFRIRAGFLAAQGLLGPLDGGWTLTDAAGAPLYALQLVDKGGGGLIEGVWRDLRRTPTPSTSGLISSIDRLGSQLTVTFFPVGRGLAKITLNSGLDGRWVGRLSEGGDETTVSLKRE